MYKEFQEKVSRAVWPYVPAPFESDLPTFMSIRVKWGNGYRVEYLADESGCYRQIYVIATGETRERKVKPSVFLRMALRWKARKDTENAPASPDYWAS